MDGGAVKVGYLKMLISAITKTIDRPRLTHRY